MQFADHSIIAILLLILKDSNIFILRDSYVFEHVCENGCACFYI